MKKYENFGVAVPGGYYETEAKAAPMRTKKNRMINNRKKGVVKKCPKG